MRPVARERRGITTGDTGCKGTATKVVLIAIIHSAIKAKKVVLGLLSPFLRQQHVKGEGLQQAIQGAKEHQLQAEKTPKILL